MKATKALPLGLPQMKLVTEQQRQESNRELFAGDPGSYMGPDDFINMVAAELFDEGRKVTRIEFFPGTGHNIAAIYYNV